MEEEAEKEIDPVARNTTRERALEYKRLWGCGEDSIPPLTPQREDALGAVERLCGHRGKGGCPVQDTATEEVHWAVKCRHWRNHGQLQIIEPEPCATLVEAIDLIEIEVSKRERIEMDRIKPGSK